MKTRGVKFFAVVVSLSCILFSTLFVAKSIGAPNNPNGYCCNKGKVTATKTACKTEGGKFYTTKPEALKNCKDDTVFCCSAGKVSETSPEQCKKNSGESYKTKTEAKKKCTSPKVYCCIQGKVDNVSPGECKKSKGTAYATASEAKRKCTPEDVICCINGKIKNVSPGECKKKGRDYATTSEAKRQCKPKDVICCINGKVKNVSPGECKKKGKAYSTASEAKRLCKPQKVYCCVKGNVKKTTSAQCIKGKGGSFTSKDKAYRECKNSSLKVFKRKGEKPSLPVRFRKGQDTKLPQCCINGKLEPYTSIECRYKDGTYFANAKVALTECNKGGKASQPGKGFSRGKFKIGDIESEGGREIRRDLTRPGVEPGQPAEWCINRYTIRGRVISDGERSGTGILNVPLMLIPDDDRSPTRQIRTSLDGRYEFVGVCPGFYTIKAETIARGVIDIGYDDYFVDSIDKAVEIQSGNWVVPDFELRYFEKYLVVRAQEGGGNRDGIEGLGVRIRYSGQSAGRPHQLSGNTNEDGYFYGSIRCCRTLYTVEIENNREYPFPDRTKEYRGELPPSPQGNEEGGLPSISFEGLGQTDPDVVFETIPEPEPVQSEFDMLVQLVDVYNVIVHGEPGEDGSSYDIFFNVNIRNNGPGTILGWAPLVHLIEGGGVIGRDIRLDVARLINNDFEPLDSGRSRSWLMRVRFRTVAGREDNRRLFPRLVHGAMYQISVDIENDSDTNPDNNRGMRSNRFELR